MSKAKRDRATFPAQTRSQAVRYTVLAQAIGMAFLASNPAYAQQAPATQELGTVTVTGIRRGIEAAISQKKNSDSIVEAISAEDIGKLPDVSVAESLARLPGVAAQRNGGRAQQISIRGLAPDFAGALLNGREQVTTGDSRGVEFDQYPSELLASVLVYKTPDGSLLGQGLSGTIDMRTVRPLDFAGRQFAVNARKQRTGVGLDQEGKGTRFNLSYIDQFADRKFGVAVGFSRFSEKSAVTTRFEAWGVADDAKLNGAGPNLKAPGGFNAWGDQTDQTRDGLMAVLQFKPSKSFNTTLDVFTSKFTRDKQSIGFQAPVGFSSGGGYDPNGTLIRADVANGVATSGTYNNFKGVVRNDRELTTDKLTAIGSRSELKFSDDWSGVFDISRSTAKRVGTILESTAGLPGNGNQGGATDTISWTGFDGTSVQGANFTTGLSYADRAKIKLTDVMGWGGGNATPQAGYSKLPNVNDKLNQLKLSGKRNLGEGFFFSNAEFGFNLTDRKKSREYIEGRLVIGSTPYAIAEIPGDGSAVVGSTGISVATWNPTALLGSVYAVAPKLVGDIANKDWTVKEKVTTLFTKLDIDSKLAGANLRGNVGLQFVQTDQSSTAFSVDGQKCPGDVCPTTNVTDGKKYNDVLPSANFVWEVAADQNLRLGIARVLARPNINDMRASFGFSVDNKGVQILKGEAGNPQLDPFRANAIDLSWEKYWGNKAYVSVAAFQKKLQTFIIKQEQPYNFAPQVTASTPLPTSGAFAGSTLGLLKRPVNGSGGSLSGIELAGSMPFDLVVPALKGLGGFANYSYTKSAVKLPTSGFANDNISAGEISLPGLSKHVSTIGVYYELAGFSARAAQRKRSDFVGDVTTIFGDRSLTYVKGERIIDLQIGYELQSGPAKGLSFGFQVLNLENTPFIRYKDTPDNEIEKVKYGRTYLLGVSYKF